MTLGESAELAVTRYFERWRECRKLEASIYGGTEIAKLSKRQVAAGRRFILSELYGLPLDNSEPRYIFRCCRNGAAEPSAFNRFDGVFAFTQNLMTQVCESVSNRSEQLASYSECLSVPLFRYTRGEELLVSKTSLNSVYADGASIPLASLTSKRIMSGIAFENVDYAVIAVHNCNLRDLDRYCGDWNLPRLNRKASYKKDREVLTNLPAQYRFGNLSVLREYVLSELTGDLLPCPKGFEVIAEYLRDNLEYERRCYKSVAKAN